MPEIEPGEAKLPFNLKHATNAYKLGLLLTPIAYPLILAKWGNSFPGWLIVAFAGVVVGLFLLAGLLHLREIGGRGRLKDNLHSHPIPYLLAAMILSGMVFGTGTYLVVRPPEKTLKNKSNPILKPPISISPRSSPSIPLSAATAKSPTLTNPRQRKPSSNKGPYVSSTAPSTQLSPTVNCNNNEGNCAGTNSGQQIINQYNAPEPVHISASQAEMITKELRKIPNLSGTVSVEYEYAAQDGAESANNLAKALNDAGISASSSGAVMEMGGCNPTTQFPGLYFDCMTENNTELANAIALALHNAKVTSGKIHGLEANYANAVLVILIRKQ